MSIFCSLREALAYIHEANYSISDLINLVVRGELRVCFYTDGYFIETLRNDDGKEYNDNFYFEGYITSADSKFIEFLSHSTSRHTVYLSRIALIEYTGKHILANSEDHQVDMTKTYGVDDFTKPAIFVEGRGLEFSNDDSSIDFIKLKKLLPVKSVHIEYPPEKASESVNMNESTNVVQQNINVPRKISEDENLVIIGAIIDLLFNEKAIVRTQNELVQKLLERHYPNTKYITDSTLKKNFAAANTKFEKMKNNK